MSKRAEIAALRAYPKSDFNGVETRRKGQRKCFIKGYEQAEKDTIERATEWLSSLEDGIKIVDVKVFINAFRNEIK